MSKYQRLLEQSGTEGVGAGGSEAAAADEHTTTTTREGGTTTPNTRAHNANAQSLLFTDSSSNDSSSRNGDGGDNSNSHSRVMMRNNNNNLSNSNKSNNNNNSNSSSNSLISRSSASSSWEYSPFESANTNGINAQMNVVDMLKTTTTTATTTSTTLGTTMNFVAGSALTSSTSLLLDVYDVDDTTMEVPLLGGAENNNVDNQDHDNHQFSTASGGTAIFADTTCQCQLPGFNANLRAKSAQNAKFKILLAITLCCIFMIVEFLGGYMAGSLAIMTDAAHLASDCISFVIGLVAIWLGGRPPDTRMSFGYKRMEVMGAIISILGIWILTATLIMVAIERLYSNDFDLNANTMMVISGIGILINIVMAFILHGSPLGGGAHGHSHAHSHSHSHTAAAGNTLLQMNGANGSDNELKHANKCDTEENLNLRAAMIHVIGDLVQSIGVFLASILIQFYPNAKFADPLCTLLFSVIVFMTTVHLFRESVGILLDSVPASISLDMLTMDLINIDGVKSVHHLNVWSHTNNYSVMMVHLVIDFLSDSNKVLQRATQIACSSKYDIKHCTIQIERLTS